MPFDAGDRVRVRPQRSHGHTRVPGYLARRSGIVERRIGDYAFPDDRVDGKGTRPQTLYCVRFAASDVWEASPPGDVVRADLFESYLEPL